MVSEQLRRLAGRRGQAAVPDLGAELSEADARLLEQAQAREKLEQGFEAFPPRTERIGQHIKTMLGKSGVKSGRILEIGGRAIPTRTGSPASSTPRSTWRSPSPA